MSSKTITSTAPNAARGEVLITIGGEKYPIRFGMNVIRDFTELTGKGPSEFGDLLVEDNYLVLTGILACAVRRYVKGAVEPTKFTQEDAADLIDAMTKEEADAVAEAILLAITTGNPLLASLTARVVSNPKTQAASVLPKNGTTTSTSDLES